MKQINPFKNYFLARIYCKLFSSQENYYKSFFDSVLPINPGKENVLMYVGIGDMFLSPLEILIYHLLRNRSCNVDYYIYDESIPINEVITKDRVESIGKEVFWRNSVHRAKLNLVASRVNYSIIESNKEVSSIIQNLNNLESIFTFRLDDIDFGEIVKGVMFRYYKSLKFGKDSFDVARNFLMTSLTNYFKVRELHSINKYQYIIFSHGIYCTWQPVVQFCKKNNIPFVCYDRAKVKGECNFNLNIPAPVWDISEAWKRWRDYSLNNNELEKVRNYLQERELQKGDVYAYNFKPRETDIKELKRRLDISENVTVVTIFTNLIWDAANVSRDIAFSSPLDCITKTIDYYSHRKDVHIVIRSHPAEKVLGTKERYGELVRLQFSNVLPSNVTIIEPEDGINSFSVLELSDIGVVHTSTVGLEMAIEGKPVIVISETHYRDKGFTYDALNEEDYFLKLDFLISSKELKINQIDLALKYFYLMMFEYQQKMPMIFTDKGQFNGYGYRNFAELLKDTESPINRIIKRLCSKDLFTDFIFRD
jgi:hypothetical protein